MFPDLPWPPMRTLARATVLAGVVAAATLGPGMAAQAHSRLIRTEPAGGTTVAAGPSSVRLFFDEAVQSRFAVVAVTGPAGVRIDRGPPAASGTTIDQRVEQPTTAGTYLVAYRVVSADGHPGSGEFRFTYAPPAASSPMPTPSASPTRAVARSSTQAAAPGSADPGAAGGHLLHYVGSILAIVITLAVVAVERVRSRRRT